VLLLLLFIIYLGLLPKGYASSVKAVVRLLRKANLAERVGMITNLEVNVRKNSSADWRLMEGKEKN
jgi:hypothetical protein